MASHEARQFLAAAQAARQAGDRAGEGRALASAAAAAPDDPQIRNAVGLAALDRGEAELAKAHFEAALRRDDAVPLFINLATASRALHDDAAEAAALEQVLGRDRRHFIGNLRLAELRERQEDMAAAAMLWSGVVQLGWGMSDRPPLVADAIARGTEFLARANRNLQAALDARVGDKLAAMGEGARRARACFDHSLHGRRIYANECAGVHFPFLPADEFFPRAHFPWLADLEARTAAIREEALALLANGGAAIRPYVRQDKGTPQNKWSELDNSLDWSACFLWEEGTRNDAICDLCPETAAAIAAVPQNHLPGRAPTAFFSVLAPGAHIPAHTGVTNTRAIVHLPLVVPKGCRFRVGGETRMWREGEAFAFDDTIEHEAWNDSAERRIVLIFDVWNPYLTLEERDLLVDFFAVVGTAQPIKG